MQNSATSVPEFNWMYLQEYLIYFFILLGEIFLNLFWVIPIFPGTDVVPQAGHNSAQVPFRKHFIFVDELNQLWYFFYHCWFVTAMVPSGSTSGNKRISVLNMHSQVWFHSYHCSGVESSYSKSLLFTSQSLATEWQSPGYSHIWREASYVRYDQIAMKVLFYIWHPLKNFLVNPF